jgi:hypothetical protein
MAGAKYIGRVGGLAAAMGVGIAVATTPGVAWAEPTDSGSSATDSSATSKGATSSSAHGGSSPPASVRSTGITRSRAIGSTADDPRSGLAQSSRRVQSNTIGPATDVGPGAGSPVDATKPSSSNARSPGALVRGPRAGSDKRRQVVDRPAIAPRVDARNQSAVRDATTSRPQPAQDPVTTVSSSSVPQAKPVVSQTMPVAAAAQMTAATTPISPASSRLADVLTWAGLSRSVTDNPVAPAASPAMLTLLAGRRRQSQQALTGEMPTNLAALQQTSQTVDPMITSDQALADASATQLSAPVSLAAADTTPPTVAITSPGGTVSGVVTVSATASDNVGVTGVQFLVNGGTFGAEDTTGPYNLSVDTTAVTNGTYTLTARARDAAGNITTSAPVTLTVANSATPPSDVLAVSATSLFVDMNSQIPDQLTTLVVQGSDGKNRLIISMTGVNGSSAASKADALRGNTGVLNPKVGAYIDAEVEAAHPDEVMLVGFSAGGQEMQNYAATGAYKDLVTVLVLYGAPLTQTASQISAESLLLLDQGDTTYTTTTHSDADASYRANPNDQWAIFTAGTPSTVNTHLAFNQTYYADAQEFDAFVEPLSQDVDYARIYADMQRFGGTILESDSILTEGA